MRLYKNTRRTIVQEAPDGHDGVALVLALAVVLVHVTALPALVAVLYAQRSVLPAIVLIFQPNVPGLVAR